MANLKRGSIHFICMLVTFALTFVCTTMLYASQHEKEKITTADVKQETAEAYVTLKEYTVDQRDEAVAATRDQLEKIDTQIDALQKDINQGWDQMSEATQQKKQATLQALRKKRNNVAEWFGGLQHSSAAAWEEVKKGFGKSYNQLQNAFSKASDEFESDKAKNNQ